MFFLLYVSVMFLGHFQQWRSEGKPPCLSIAETRRVRGPHTAQGGDCSNGDVVGITFPQMAMCYFAIKQCVRTAGSVTVG